MQYPIDLEIQYTDDDEYRQCICRLFQIQLSNDGDFDPSQFKAMLESIYDSTCNIRVFQKLYKDAAAKVISEDTSLGLAILFSYDYFAAFHRVLCGYYRAIEADEAYDVSSKDISTLRALMQ